MDKNVCDNTLVFGSCHARSCIEVPSLNAGRAKWKAFYDKFPWLKGQPFYLLCKRWEPWCHILFCYLYLHKEDKNLMVGSHFAMTEDKKKTTRLATTEERLMLFEEMFKYGIAFDKHVHHLIGNLIGV